MEAVASSSSSCFVASCPYVCSWPPLQLRDTTGGPSNVGGFAPQKNPQTSSATAITRFTRQSVGNDVTPHFGWPSSDLVRIAATTSSCFCRERDLSVSNLQLSVPTLCRSERHRTFCCANVRSACQSVRQSICQSIGYHVVRPSVPVGPSVYLHALVNSLHSLQQQRHSTHSSRVFRRLLLQLHKPHHPDLHDGMASATPRLDGLLHRY